MPNYHFTTLKMSLLSGLFVFIYLLCFNRCFYLLHFIARIISITSRHSIKNPNCNLKQAYFFCRFGKAVLKFLPIPLYFHYFFQSIQKDSKYTLPKNQYSKKSLKYCLKVLKSSLYKLKSIQKPSIAIEIYSTRLLCSIIQVRHRSFFYPNPTL